MNKLKNIKSLYPYMYHDEVTDKGFMKKYNRRKFLKKLFKEYSL